MKSKSSYVRGHLIGEAKARAQQRPNDFILIDGGYADVYQRAFQFNRKPHLSENGKFAFKGIEGRLYVRYQNA